MARLSSIICCDCGSVSRKAEPKPASLFDWRLLLSECLRLEGVVDDELLLLLLDGVFRRGCVDISVWEMQLPNSMSWRLHIV